MSSIIFGPITSRRFGQSLGIDLSPNRKQCNFDCLYCELKGAKTVEKAIDTPSVESILDELDKALKQQSHIDVITLTANGEPTLYPDLERLIEGIQAFKGAHKLLILSNGSTIADPHMQTILSKIDIVKLSLDCVEPACFKKLDRAHQGIDIRNIVEGMKAFRAMYHGELVVEILVVEGLNDTPEAFQALNTALQSIQPNRIDIGTIDRPPAYGVKGVSVERLMELSAYLEGLHVNIAYAKHYSAPKRLFSEEAIVALLKRRPQSFEYVSLCFNDESVKHLHALVEAKRVHVTFIAGVGFYTSE